MTWLAVIRLAFSLANTLLTYVQQRQLITAGEAKQLAKDLERSLALLDKIRKAGDDAASKFDNANGVPDDTDPNLRD